MTFIGISRDFDLTDEKQYETIGQFWDEMTLLYGLENLRGLGYSWRGSTISYAIGLKQGSITDYNVEISLPDNGWTTVNGHTYALKDIYDSIYKDGRLEYEIEVFNEDGTCEISYCRIKQ